VAPDRFVSAIHLTNGNTIWRTKEGGLRESIGISADGQWLYGKSMQDTLVAFPTSAELPKASWKMPVGYGYDHVPSMLIEEEGTLFFGTRNGVVYAVDPQSQRTIWAHKVDNAMVNTIRVINRREMLVSTMDGRLVKLSYRGAF
jgi:outer membrane protein assembly factor BamB